jgi:hypothetical protein
MAAIEPVNRITALSRVALVAARAVNIIEVGAAGALQDVAEAPATIARASIG